MAVVMLLSCSSCAPQTTASFTNSQQPHQEHEQSKQHHADTQEQRYAGLNVQVGHELLDGIQRAGDVWNCQGLLQSGMTAAGDQMQQQGSVAVSSLHVLPAVAWTAAVS